MKEDEEAIKSIKLQIRDDEGFTEEVYNYTLCHFVCFNKKKVLIDQSMVNNFFFLNEFFLLFIDK